MDARKPDPATQSGDRIETRPPEDIFSSLPPEAPVPDGQPRKRSLFARILQVFRLIFVGDAEREQRPATRHGGAPAREFQPGIVRRRQAHDAKGAVRGSGRSPAWSDAG